MALIVSLTVLGLLAWLATRTKEKHERKQTISVVTRTSQLTERPRATPLAPPPETEPQQRARPNEPTGSGHQGGRPRGPILDFPLLPGEAAPTPSPKLGILPSNGQPLGGTASGTGTPGAGGDGDSTVDLFNGNTIGNTARHFAKPNEQIEGGSGPERGDLSEAQRAQVALDHMMTDQNEMYHADKTAKPPRQSCWRCRCKPTAPLIHRPIRSRPRASRAAPTSTSSGTSCVSSTSAAAPAMMSRR